MRTLQIEVAEVFEPLLAPSRYKGAHGGRGSGKSHFFAGLLIEDSLAEKGMLSVCVREVQKSLKDSAKRLIESKLIEYRLGEADGFKVFNEKIQTPGDGVILFQGMQDHTAESIKSLEGFKRAWAEEAQTLSTTSLTLLRPTIRADGSEIWASWNPRRKSDPIDVLLRGKEPPTGATVVRANWSDAGRMLQGMVVSEEADAPGISQDIRLCRHPWVTNSGRPAALTGESRSSLTLMRFGKPAPSISSGSRPIHYGKTR